MSLENFVNWTVSIDCGAGRGNYQGQIKSVDQLNQTLTLKHPFHNGILLDEHFILIEAKDIEDLNLLSEPGSSFQIPKTINKKSLAEQAEQQLKAAPIANNGSFLSSLFRISIEKQNKRVLGVKCNPASGMNGSQPNRSRSSKSWSDEATNENEMNDDSKVDRDYSNVLSLKSSSIVQTNAEKYRCDQMILEHNNGPIDYEQIQLPIPTTKKYLTGLNKRNSFLQEIFVCR